MVVILPLVVEILPADVTVPPVNAPEALIAEPVMFVDFKLVNPVNVVEEEPKEIEVVPIVILSLASLAFVILPSVTSAVTEVPAVTVKSIVVPSTKLPASNTKSSTPEVKWVEDVFTVIASDTISIPFPTTADAVTKVVPPALDTLVEIPSPPLISKIWVLATGESVPVSADAVNEYCPILNIY